MTQPADATISDAIWQLISEEERNRPLRRGNEAPIFTLADIDGTSHSLSATLELGPAVVTFYRGLWCPNCRTDLEECCDSFLALQQNGASMLAVSRSPDPRLQAPVKQPFALPFPVLNDAEGDVAVSYGLRWAAEDTTLIEDAFGIGDALFRGTEPWIVPRQARFVIAPDRTLIFSEIAFASDPTSSPADLLPLLREIGAERDRRSA